jgi:hypothetical protein
MKMILEMTIENLIKKIYGVQIVTKDIGNRGYFIGCQFNKYRGYVLKEEVIHHLNYYMYINDRRKKLFILEILSD